MCIRDSAWSARVPVAAVGRLPRDGDFVAEMRNTYKLIGSLYRVTYESFLFVNRLYSAYFRYYIFALIWWLSIQIISTAKDKNMETFVLSVTVWVLMDMVVLFAYASITSELKTLQGMFNWFCYKSSLNKARNETLALLCQSAHRDNKFDCGFFDIDFTKFSFIVDFVPLIVFNLLEISN